MAYGITQSAGLVAASNQFFTTADSASLSITGDITIEAWVKFTTTSSTLDDRQMIVSKPNTTGNGYDAYALELHGDGTNVELRGGCEVSGQQFVVYDWNPSTDTWYYVAYTRDATSGVQKLYVDVAAEVASASNTSGATADSAHGVYLGRFGVLTALNLNGRLSLVRIWDTVRSGAQLYANKCSVLGSTTNLQAEWTLDNVLTDNSGNSNTLSNGTGSPTFTTDIPAICPTFNVNSGFFNLM